MAAAAKGVVRLHSYYRSPTSFLARIGLNLKGVAYEYVPLELENDNRGHGKDGIMPYLEDSGRKVTQTGAIFNYINETWPEPPLLPGNAMDKARIRSIATFVSCEVQPFGFYRVDRYLKDVLNVDEKACIEWHRHWLGDGFKSVDAILSQPETGLYSHGNSPTMADLFLIPQVHRSQLPDIGLDLKDFPAVRKVYENCLKLEAFDKALPENQPDAKKDAPWQ